ncbi:MAG: hypothetical protein GY806_18365 [Gammaproteobacteria bacterium]|nr:hypothetical protein [Gammaproteobacteria bacterium]
MSNYQTLLRIAVKHRYHRAQTCHCLHFYPSEKTRKVFDNTGILCRPSNDGILLAYDQSRVEALRLYAEDKTEPLYFEFKVFSSDPHFKSYTEPYGLDNEAILYFNNSATSKPDSMHLSQLDLASGQDLKTLDDFKVLNDTEDKAEPETVSLRTILSPQDFLMPPVFVLHIFTNGGQGSFLEQWLVGTPTQYVIHFDSRERYWKYYLLGNMADENHASEDYYVVDPDNVIQFETLGEEFLPGRKRVFTFKSKQKIPLTEDYSFQFQLKKKDRGMDALIIDGLPVADVKQVGKDSPTGADNIVSEIYINS